MKQLQLRMLATFVLIFALFSVAFGIFLETVLGNYTRNLHSELLVEQTQIVGTLLQNSADGSDWFFVEEELDKIDAFTEDRITLVDTDGVVLYDSQITTADLENHLRREEIQEVLSGEPYGTGQRKSESTNQELYYVAVPIHDEEGAIVAVIRLSRPLSALTVSQRIEQSLYVFILLALVVAFILTYALTKRIGRPIDAVMDVAKNLSDHQYDARYKGKGFGDFQKLGETINELAESLDNQMNEIKQNDERLTGLINHLVIGVMLLDENKEITMVNAAMQEILSESEESLVGQSYVEAVSSYGLSHMIERAYTYREPQNDEIYFYYPKDRVVDANIVPITSKKPGEMNLIVLLYDISEIRRLEKVRTDFVANASHELRTPVTALKGFAETLLDGAMEDPVILKQFLEIILAESTRLNLLVNDILELSKLEQRQVPLALQEVNISEAVLATFQLVNQKVKEKNMTLELVEKDYVTLQTDPNRLKQILANLINNAVVYTQAGGHITVTVEKTAEQVRLHVADNGIGIPEADLGRVFERFYRVDRARSRNSGGTGLGLSIVKYLVENMNGTVIVASKQGKGTTFTVTLPL